MTHLDGKVFLHTDAGARSYGELFGDLRAEKAYRPFCQSPDLYAQFKNLIAAIVGGRDLTLLDSNFSRAELENLVDPTLVNCAELLELAFASPEEFTAKLRTSPSRITLFTSGTTGRPKKITHTATRFSASVRRESRFADDVWAYAFSPTHMAGLQVFFQALLNLNTLVDIFAKPKDSVLRLLRDHGVTHLSATPTFYRLLLPPDFSIACVRRVTLGGERSDGTLHARIQTMFPNARIANIYASTEAGTILKSNSSDFEVPPALRDKVKVKDGELLIHRSLLGAIGEPGRGSGSTSADLRGDWYATSDVVEVVGQNPLRLCFQSRRNEMINIGGYKVNPAEVEEVLGRHEQVLNALVFPRKNSVLGNILVAQIQKAEGAELSEKDMRAYLETHLQPFKIPRMIKFVEKLDMTNTGKAKRS